MLYVIIVDRIITCFHIDSYQWKHLLLLFRSGLSGNHIKIPFIELQHTEQRYRIFTGDNIIDIQNDRHINLRILDVGIKFRLRIFHLVIVHNGLLPYFPGRRNVVEQAGCNIFHFRIVSSHTYQDHVLLICRIVLIRPRNIINDIPNASPEKNTWEQKYHIYHFCFHHNLF